MRKMRKGRIRMRKLYKKRRVNLGKDLKLNFKFDKKFNFFPFT
jgi:hypothetical protein